MYTAPFCIAESLSKNIFFNTVSSLWNESAGFISTSAAASKNVSSESNKVVLDLLSSAVLCLLVQAAVSPGVCLRYV